MLIWKINKRKIPSQDCFASDTYCKVLFSLNSSLRLVPSVYLGLQSPLMRDHALKITLLFYKDILQKQPQVPYMPQFLQKSLYHCCLVLFSADLSVSMSINAPPEKYSSFSLITHTASVSTSWCTLPGISKTRFHFRGSQNAADVRAHPYTPRLAQWLKL